MKSKKIILLIITLLLYNNSKAQTFEDSNKKTLITILPKDSKRFSYSVGGTAAEVLFVIKKYNENNYILKSDVAQYNNTSNDKFITSKDASLFFVSASINDVNKSYNDFFSKYNQPKIEISFSYAINSVTWVNWDKLSLYKNTFFRQWDFYVKYFANNTFTNYYDLDNNKVIKTKDWGLFNTGLQSDFIGYNKRFWIALTGTGYIGMQTDNLKSYQDGIPTSINTENNIVSLGKSVGKYGSELERNQLNFRTSIAFPIFLGDLSNTKSNKVISRLCLIPNYNQYGTIKEKWYNVAGASLGVLNYGYNSNNNDCIKIKPMLQFGVDWQSNPLENKWGKPNWIFSFKGTFK
jgi:hypothetical protein